MIADGLTQNCGDRINPNGFYVLDIQYLEDDGTMSDPDGIQMYLGETIQEALETLQGQWEGSDGTDMWGGEDFRHELGFEKFNRDFGKHVQEAEVA